MAMTPPPRSLSPERRQDITHTADLKASAGDTSPTDDSIPCVVLGYRHVARTLRTLNASGVLFGS